MEARRQGRGSVRGLGAQEMLWWGWECEQEKGASARQMWAD